MTENLKRGDKVAWNTSQGATRGTVERKLTGDTEVKSHEVRASKDDPQYLVKSDKTGTVAAHKLDALKQRR